MSLRSRDGKHIDLTSNRIGVTKAAKFALLPFVDRSQLSRAKRIVVKLGTNALTRGTGTFQPAHFKKLGKDVLAAARDREVVVVSSGAIALGVQRLKLSSKPKDLPGRQACAAVGQSRLMNAWEAALNPRVVAQILLTHDDMQNRRRYLNARHTLARLLDEGAIPVINENDTVSVDEIKFGDNDALAALVAGLVGADLLVILSDVEALYDDDPRKNPNAKQIPNVPRIDDEVLSLAGGASSAVGTGGMLSKVLAAKKATALGIPTVITSGQVPGRLAQLFAGEEVGTYFAPHAAGRNARDAWIGQALKPRGRLFVDDGARSAVMEKKKSLLPKGVTRVEGHFDEGEPVDLCDLDGKPFARGLACHDAASLTRLAGQKSSEMVRLLGYHGRDEAVHRDDLVLL